MISWILSSDQEQKKEELKRQIAERLSDGKSVYILVPEQYTLQMEKNMQKDFEKQLSNQLMVLNFPRFAHLLFKTYGGIARSYASPTMKVILMNLALQEAYDGLSCYKKTAKTMGFDQLMVETVDELKHAAVSADKLFEIGKILPSGIQKQKILDTALLYSMYDGLLYASCKDPIDDILHARTHLIKHRFLKNAAVFIDGFISFGGAQLAFLEEMMKQTDMIFSAFYDFSHPVFAPIAKTIRVLQAMAGRNDVVVQAPLMMDTPAQEKTPFTVIKEELFHPKTGKVPEAASAVHIFLAQSEYQEADILTAKILEKVRQGYRFRDMALLTRNLPEYQGVLESAFKRYQVPYHMDRLMQAEEYPLFRCMLALLEAVRVPLDTEAVLQLLKSGLTCFDTLEISYFENYLYTWNIRRKKLMKPFTQNPHGFTDREMTEEDRAILQTAENVREKVVRAVQMIIEAKEDAICLGQAFMDALDVLGITQKYREKMDSSDAKAAEEMYRVFSALVEIIDTLSDTIGTHGISLPRYLSLFRMAILHYDFGIIPQTLDAVLIGDAAHTLVNSPKIVFLFGVNEGYFPLQPNMEGIFTASDREMMAYYGIQFSKDLMDRILEEQLYAYMAVCLPSEELFVSARLADITGTPFYPSEIITQLIEIFGKNVVTDLSDADILTFCQNRESAFYQLSFHYYDHQPQTELLRRYFKDDERIKKFAVSKPPSQFSLEEPSVIRKLFSEGLTLSPTRIEQYFRCPFSFFCAYGLHLRPRAKAELNGLYKGLVTHYVLERFMKCKEAFSMDEQALSLFISQVTADYMRRFMGGKEDKTLSFMQEVLRLERNLKFLLQNLQQEFAENRFRPIAFEMPIRQTISPSSAYEAGENPLKFQIFGIVDRVDSCLLDGKEYLRVVDYKSGYGKTLSFSELSYGLNMQMLIYLFAVMDAKKNAVPAGVLYLPTAGDTGKYIFNRKAPSKQEMYQKVKEGFQMNGILLNDHKVIHAMENFYGKKKGNFIPLKTDPVSHGFKETANGFLLNLQDIELLKGFVKRKLEHMSICLGKGEVPAYPLQQEEKVMCAWCDYQSVCGRRAGDKSKKMEKISKEEFFHQLGEEDLNRESGN